MKKIYLLMVLLAGLAFNPIKAQVDTNAIIKAYLNSDYIFEGVVQDICYYNDPATGNIYTSNQILITKIIKGNLQCGTVNIITPGGVLNGYEIHVSEQTEFNVGVAGVFMCIKSTYPLSKCDINNNTVQDVQLTVAFQGTIEYLFDNINAEVEGFNLRFQSIQEFYDFLHKNGINIIDCNGSIIQQMRNKAYAKKATTQKIFERSPTLYSEERVVPKSKAYLLTKKTKNTVYNKSSINLEFVISNISLNDISGNCSNKEYVVEISVKSNVNTTYLEGAVFRLKYNTASLGTNIFSAITYGRTANFPSTTYDFIGGNDLTNSDVQISIQSIAASPTWTQITGSPTPLIVLHIPVNNCKNYGNFVIDTFTSNGATYYGLSSTDPYGKSYDTTISSSSNQGSLCFPIITSLSNNSTQLHGGISDILTIDGCNFGNQKGDIFMYNADGANNPSTIAIDQYDITQWTNTHIEVKVPSQVDSGHYDVTSQIYKKHPVGTGYITVSDAYGYTKISSDIVTVKYAVTNRSQVYPYPVGFAKANQFLFSANSDHKYHFKLNSNITNQKMIDCIKAGIRRWSCTTGVPFVIDAGTVTNNADSDGVNVIKLTSLGIGSSFTTHAQTWSRTVYSCSTSPSIPYPSNEIDIEINSDAMSKFQYDTTGNYNLYQDSVDFFEVILHELGHGLCLKHTLNASDIMFWQSGVGYTSAASRRIYIKNNDLGAANYVVNNSLSTPSGLTCTFNIPIQKLTTPCTWNNAIKEVSDNLNVMEVFPNPFNNTLNISFNKDINEKVNIRVVNILGEVVYSSSFEQINSGKNIELNNLNLNDGIYFILVNGNTISLNKKVFCTK